MIIQLTTYNWNYNPHEITPLLFKVATSMVACGAGKWWKNWGADCDMIDMDQNWAAKKKG